MSKVLEILKNKGWKHLCLWFFIYITLLQTFTARWVVSWLKIPGVVTKATTLLLYLPLCVFVLWKLICDVQKRKLTAFNVCYYGFAAYYFCLTVVRYFIRAEIKENLYYTIVLMGSVALFDLIRNKNIRVDKKIVSDDILYFSLFMLAYRLLHILVLKRYIYYSPINEIAICGCLVILLPLVVKKLLDADKKTAWLCAVSLFGMLAVLMTLQSRVGFWVMVVECVILAGYVLVKKRGVLQFFAAVFAAVLLVAGLFALDFGEVRYAVYREIGIAIPDTNDPHNPLPSPLPDEQQQANAQIQRSDLMREELFELALAEFKENPLFGTGNLFYSYEVAGGVYEAPAHNFILVTLNAYGSIGMLLVVAMVFLLLLQMGVFRFKEKKIWEYLFLCLLTLGIYLGVGLVQATVYDFQVMPVLFVILGAFSMFLEEEKTEKTQENDPV